MEKEIQVPNFVNENYKKNQEEQKELERQIEIRKIKNIKFFKKTCRNVLIAAIVAGGAIALSKTPMAGKVADAIIDYDNKKFEEHVDNINEDVYQNTGRTISEQLEILEHPNLTREDVIEEEKKTQSYR